MRTLDYTVDYDSTDVNDVLHIHIHLKKKQHKMFRFVKQVLIALLRFSGSLVTIVNVSNFATFISLNNPPCMSRPFLIDLNSNECN